MSRGKVFAVVGPGRVEKEGRNQDKGRGRAVVRGAGDRDCATSGDVRQLREIFTSNELGLYLSL